MKIIRSNSLPTGFVPYLIITVAPLCWAGNIVLARGVIHIIPPVAFAFWRWAIAFLILLPFAWQYAKKDWRTALKNWKILVLLSVFGISCFNTLLYTAVHTTTAINGSLIQTAMPAVIILLSLSMFKEKISAIQIFGVTLSIFGAVLVILRGQITSIFQLSIVKGDILIAIAVVLYALYSALLRKRPGIHPLSFLIYTFGIGTLGLLPLYLIERSSVAAFTLNRDVILSILYVAMFPSIVSYLCWNRGIELIGANRAGLFINLVPVFASIMAMVWLNEALHGFHILGMVLIFSGMIIFNKRQRT